MAEFCNQCAPKMFGADVKPDIDVIELSKDIKPGYYLSVLCEGCGMFAIIRESDNTIKLAFPAIDEDESADNTPILQTLSDWQNSAS